MLNKIAKANSTLLGLSLLNLAPLLWGSSYVVLKQTITAIPPSLLTLISYTLAALCFTPFLRNNKRLRKAGLELGFWLLLGSATQTIGLQYTSASRSAFITTLYVVLVPLLIHLSISFPKLLAKKNRNQNIYSGAKTNQVQSSIWIAAFLALMGVGILSYDRQTPNIGDLWTLGTACSYALYIIRIENYARKFNALSLAAVQMWGAVGFSLLWVSVDRPHWFTSLQTVLDLPWTSLLYLGLVVTTGTICIQTWGQARIKSTQAAVIYTLEPVWGLVFAYLILGEVLGWRGWFGAGMIVLATVMSHWQSSLFKIQK